MLQLLVAPCERMPPEPINPGLATGGFHRGATPLIIREIWRRLRKERDYEGCVPIIVLALGSTAVAHPARAQSPETHQPSVWAAKPDVAGFDKKVDEHLAAANRWVHALVAVKATARSTRCRRSTTPFARSTRRPILPTWWRRCIRTRPSETTVLSNAGTLVASATSACLQSAMERRLPDHLHDTGPHSRAPVVNDECVRGVYPQIYLVREVEP